jgi:outer membrane protein insertion porin family
MKNTIIRNSGVLFLAVTLLGGSIQPLYAQQPGQAGTVVSDIEVKGNRTIGSEKIVSQIKLRPGQPYNENVVSEDIKRIYETGFFRDISVDVRDADGGKVTVVFTVDEKPVIRDILFKGNRQVGSRRLEKLSELKDGVFIDELKLREAENLIWGFYVKQGYPEVDIDSELRVDRDTNQATVVFTIQEQGRFRIRNVYIRGNVAYSDRKIRSLIKTRKKWLFGGGLFKQQVLEDDLERIKEFYRLQGFANVTVDYSIEKNASNEWIYVTVSINEGPRYQVGNIEIEGVDVLDKALVRRQIELKNGDIYSEQNVRRQANNITQLYFNEGYIFTQVSPLSYVNPQNDMVDLTFRVSESDLIYINRIDVRGNLRTKDKVIRRELTVKPGEPFDGDKLQRSKQNLENLGFFEEVRFEPEATGTPDQQNLAVEVTEAKTGSFSFGGGYSSVDQLIGFVELRQRNFDWKNWPYFTGAGQDLSLSFQTGSTVDEYSLSFTEPWLFDLPVSFGFDLFSRSHDRESDSGYGYDQKRQGGQLRLGRRFGDQVNVGTSYRYEQIDISDISEDASNELRKEEGSNNISAIGLSASYDTRDNVFNPRRGLFTSLATDLAGGPFGGDKEFYKLYHNLSLYVPVFKKAVVELRLRSGWADAYGDSVELPIYERFFAGGASTIRGYHERKVGPIDPISEDPIGGEAMFVGNIELTQPVGEVLKLAVFFDTGNVWARQEDFLGDDLFSSVGLGARVKTPLGPISVDYGFPLDEEPGEDKKEGRWHFNISRDF